MPATGLSPSTLSLRSSYAGHASPWRSPPGCATRSPSGRSVVGEEVVSLSLRFNILQRGAGDFAPLKRYSYFESRPHQGVSEDELNRLVDLRIRPGDGLYEKAYAAHLVTGTNQKAQRQLLAARLRSRMSFLQQVTPLHIFVVTLRCEHSCPYCQVSRQPIINAVNSVMRRLVILLRAPLQPQFR